MEPWAILGVGAAVFAVVISSTVQAVLIGRWTGRTSERLDNVCQRQDTMGLEVEGMKREHGALAQTVARLGGLFNGRHEVT